MTTQIEVTLYCPTCGQSDFDHNLEKTWLKCNNCEREFNNGLNELAEYNQQVIEEATDEFGTKLLKDFSKDLERKFKNNKFIKFKR